jgi:hypothetical protein
MTPRYTSGVPSWIPGPSARVHTIRRVRTLFAVICVSGLCPQVFSVRRHISQSAGSGFWSMASVTGANAAAGGGCWARSVDTP